MAEVLRDFSFARPQRSSKYPLAEWANGEVWLARRGTDYTVRSDSFRNILYQHAKRSNLRVRIQFTEETCTFQFSPKP